MFALDLFDQNTKTVILDLYLTKHLKKCYQNDRIWLQIWLYDLKLNVDLSTITVYKSTFEHMCLSKKFDISTMVHYWKVKHQLFIRCIYWGLYKSFVHINSQMCANIQKCTNLIDEKLMPIFLTFLSCSWSSVRASMSKNEHRFELI